MSNTLDKRIDGTHYKDMAIQPWEIIEKNHLDYFHGTVLKYLLRWQVKDGIIDLDKIIHYIEHIKELALAGHYGESFFQDTSIKEQEFENPMVKVWNDNMTTILRDEYEDLPILYEDLYKGHSKAKKKPKVTRSAKKRTKPSPIRKKPLK